MSEKHAGISATPSLPRVRRAVVDLMGRHFDKGANLKIAEFGCGWGGLAHQITRIFPKSVVTGFEISYFPFLSSKIGSMINRRFDVSRHDFFNHDWSSYDVIVCYLSAKHMAAIKERLDTMSVKPMIVSCSFAMPNTDEVEVQYVNGLVRIPVFIYR